MQGSKWSWLFNFWRSQTAQIFPSVLLERFQQWGFTPLCAQHLFIKRSKQWCIVTPIIVNAAWMCLLRFINKRKAVVKWRKSACLIHVGIVSYWLGNCFITLLLLLILSLVYSCNKLSHTQVSFGCVFSINSGSLFSSAPVAEKINPISQKALHFEMKSWRHITLRDNGLRQCVLFLRFPSSRALGGGISKPVIGQQKEKLLSNHFLAIVLGAVCQVTHY